MKKIHYAGIPCKANDAGGNTYSHVDSLITCKECKDFKNGVVKVEKAKKGKNDERRTKSDSE